MKLDTKQLKEALAGMEKERLRISNIIFTLEEVPKIKAAIGKYFKYLNSYSTKEKWWMFIHVKKMKKNELIIDVFERDTSGKIEFQIGRRDYGRIYINNPSYVEITKQEYFNTLKKILRSVDKQFKNK